MTAEIEVSRTESAEFVSVEVFNQMRSEMLAIAGSAINEAEMARESITDLMLQMDNIGWKPLSGLTDKNTGPDLPSLVRASERCRTVVVGNPIAQHGIEVRRGYIWGTGIEMRAGSGDTEGIPTITKLNQRTLFSQRARNELEMAAATDGNVFMLLSKRKKTAIRVPLAQISLYATDPEDEERITHFLRVWTVVKSGPNGSTISTPRKVWYPTIEATNEERRTHPSGDGELSDEQVMIHAAFNTHMFWHFGLPDLYNVLWWIASYKEYIEAGFSVTRALSRFALKATAPTAAGAAKAGAALASPIAVNGNTSVKEYGATASVSGGNDISAISKSGAEFDFTSGRALAAYIAAGLHIDVDVLLAENKVVGDIQLSTSTVKAMIARQGEWDDFLSAIATYFGVRQVNIRFPPVRTVAVHRAIQAVVLALSTNTVKAIEGRGLMMQLLSEYGIEETAGMPKPGEIVEFQTGLNPQKQADQAAKATADALAAKDRPAPGDPKHPGTKPLATPKGSSRAATKGKATPAGNLSAGDNTQRATANK